MSALPYHVLFLLESDTDLLFEIERLDVQSEHPADVYFWLYLDNVSGQLSQLDFVAMSTEADEHLREFTQGQLRFNTTEGTFSPTEGGSPLHLRTITPPTLPAELETALFAFFA